MCTPNHVAIRNLRCASQITVQRCFRVTHLANHAAKSLCEWMTSCVWGADLVWLLTTSAYNTARCTCKWNVNNTCMFDWQGTQTQRRLFSTLSKGKSQFPIVSIACVYCVIQNTQVLRSCVHCVIQNAHFELKFKIRTLPSCENSLRRQGQVDAGHPWTLK